MPANHSPTQKQRDSADVQDRIDIAVMKGDIAYIKKSVDDMNSTLKSNYVTRDEFYPIKRGFYLLMGLIVTAIVVAALSYLIVGKK